MYFGGMGKEMKKGSFGGLAKGELDNKQLGAENW